MGVAFGGYPATCDILIFNSTNVRHMDGFTHLRLLGLEVKEFVSQHFSSQTVTWPGLEPPKAPLTLVRLVGQEKNSGHGRYGRY